MVDDPERPGDFAALPSTERAVRVVSEDVGRSSSPGRSEETQTISLLEETAVVSKRRVSTGSLRIEMRTELRHESADLVLDRQVVDVTRVPVDRLIEEVPDVRTEGDTTIVPVVEERFVVVKQLVLKEELHIRHRTERETVQPSITLRRQSAVVERFDAEGRIIDPVTRAAPRPATPATDGT